MGLDENMLRNLRIEQLQNETQLPERQEEERLSEQKHIIRVSLGRHDKIFEVKMLCCSTLGRKEQVVV